MTRPKRWAFRDGPDSESNDARIPAGIPDHMGQVVRPIRISPDGNRAERRALAKILRSERKR